jgi:hypothetical protein
MGCPGCNYNGGCSNYVAVSYTPTITSHGPSPVSFSHKEIYTGTSDLTPGAVQYHATAPAYSGSVALNGYAGFPSEINYQISDLIKEAKIEKVATENLPAVRSEVIDAVPMLEENRTDSLKNGELSPEEKQIMEALYNQLMAKEIPQGGVRLTQIEEETIILQRKRIRVVDVLPEERKMRNANDDE